MSDKNESERYARLGNAAFLIPQRFKILVSIFCGGIVAFIALLYCYLVIVQPKRLDPDKFGLPSIFIFASSLLLVVQIPWHRFGLRIKKIGIIELEEVIKVQAIDNSKEIAELQLKIDELEAKVTPSSKTDDPLTKLEGLLVNFLNYYRGYSFSPLRIQRWGSLRAGFEELGNYQITDIKKVLRRLIAKDKVSVKVSRKGNTLYTYNM